MQTKWVPFRRRYYVVKLNWLFHCHSQIIRILKLKIRKLYSLISALHGGYQCKRKWSFTNQIFDPTLNPVNNFNQQKYEPSLIKNTLSYFRLNMDKPFAHCHYVSVSVLYLEYCVSYIFSGKRCNRVGHFQQLQQAAQKLRAFIMTLDTTFASVY